LLDHRSADFTLPNQCALGHQGTSDSTRDWRRHGGCITQIDIGCLHSSLANGYIGFSLFLRSDSGGVLCLLMAFCLNQWLVSIGQR
jgi:hypothetical protein